MPYPLAKARGNYLPPLVKKDVKRSLQLRSRTKDQRKYVQGINVCSRF
jgi:hypothetical protein